MEIINASNNSGRLRRGWWFATLLAAAVLALLPACSKSSSTFRYRLTVEVEVEGQVKTASSIIEVVYYGYGGQVGASGARAYSTFKGVAPVIDLGSRGMLVAAMDVNVAEAHRRREKYGLACKQPVAADELPKVYNLHALKLDSLRKGDKRQLADDGYPAFVWFPDGEPWREAQQLCPEEFEGVIGRVKLRTIFIEPAWGAPLVTNLEIQAPWLDQIRIDQKDRYLGRSGTFSAALSNLEWGK
jgi:hypothetical protein